MRLCLRRSACRHCCLREASYSGRRCRCTRIGLINLLLLSVCDSTSTLGVAKFTAIHVALRHIIKETTDLTKTKMFTKFTKPQEKKKHKKTTKNISAFSGSRRNPSPNPNPQPFGQQATLDDQFTQQHRVRTKVRDG